MLKKFCIGLAFVVLVGSAGIFAITVLYPTKYEETIEYYCEKYGLEEALVYSVIRSESKFRPDAQSNRAARGLMQISEQTALWGASELGLENFMIDSLYDPEVNIQIGCWYLSKLMNQYSQDQTLVLSAYNAGSGNVSKWLNDQALSLDGKTLHEIPFGETKRYVSKTLRAMEVYQFLLDVETHTKISVFENIQAMFRFVTDTKE